MRGDTRVFMEIAGVLDAGVSRAQVVELRVLASQPGEEAALIIAAPNDAAPTFAGLPYPVVAYKNTVRMTDILAVLDTRYGQREERVGSCFYADGRPAYRG